MRSSTYSCRLAAGPRRNRQAGFAEHLDPARRSQERRDAAVVAAWRGAEGRRTWRTWWQRRESEGKTRSLADAGRATATAERSGEVSGGDGGEQKAGAKHPSQTGVFDVQRGRGEVQRVRQPGRTRGQRNVAGKASSKK